MTFSKILGLAGSLLYRMVAYQRTYKFVMNLPSQFPVALVEFISSGLMKPVTKHVFDLEKAEEAHTLSRSHRATGKIILTVSKE